MCHGRKPALSEVWPDPHPHSRLLPHQRSAPSSCVCSTIGVSELGQLPSTVCLPCGIPAPPFHCLGSPYYDPCLSQPGPSTSQARPGPGYRHLPPRGPARLSAMGTHDSESATASGPPPAGSPFLPPLMKKRAALSRSLKLLSP